MRGAASPSPQIASLLTLTALVVGSGGVVVPAHAGPHADQVEAIESGRLVMPPRTERPYLPPPPTDPFDRPEVKVYGYLAYWADDLDTVRWDALTHIALFTAHATPDGSLTETSKWGDAAGALSRAEPYGVKVHLTVANFNTSELSTLLGSATARNRLIDALAAEVDRTGVHGVNVDFEGLPASARQDMVTFVRDLDARVDEVVLATPAVDWSDAWDYAALTDHADLFIMGYGYHWSGSDYAGPVDPLFGGGPWSRYSLSWSRDDYVANGADPERVILGLPLYGYAWRTASDTVPAAAQAKGEVVFYDEGADLIATHGRRLDSTSRTPWAWDGTRQAWFSDAESVRERTAWAVEADLGGIGFWALNYDDQDQVLWEGVRAETNLVVDDTDTDTDTDSDTDEDTDSDTRPTGDPSFRADAGDPFLAYVGETVQLSAEWSDGPGELRYRWTQTGGPSVQLDDATAMQPRFRIAESGVHTFEVVVGDGQRTSAPAASYVIAVEPDLSGKGCGGCSGSGAAPWLGFAGLGLGLMLLRRRRR